MGSSKKHKKHKEKDREKRPLEDETPSSDQRPLKLVLKVGSTSTTVDRPVPSSRNQFNAPVDGVHETAPKLTLAYDPISGEMTSMTSGNKHKKKKSKKKHRKHSHHSHHSHHHHHHHRHKSSCSHHAKSASSSSIPALDQPMSSELNVPMQTDVPPPVLEHCSPIEIDTQQPMVQDPYPMEIIPAVLRSPSKISSLKAMTKTFYAQFLSYIVRQIQRRDSQEFFAWPVTDIIAPGYSSIVHQPMDFSTIKKKIDQRIYENIGEMKADVKLMCDNAMLYNQPETIYYKAARKLWHFARENVFSREALAEAQKMCVVVNTDSNIQIPPFQLDGTQIVPDMSVVGELDVSTDESNPPAGDVIETNFDFMYESEMTPEQILEQARRAAAGAAERLSLEKPAGAHFSFLRQRPDGSTSLAIIGSDTGPERIIRLEDLVGKLTEGLPYLQPYKEPEKNRVHLVETIETPPFSSYLPSIDSCKANISREESALLLSTYGDDELATQYAQSLLQFAGDSEYISGMADSLLDVLTQGQHSKGLAQLKNLQEKPQKEENETEKVDEEGDDEFGKGLQESAEIISKLQDVQTKRLSSGPKPTNPESEETSLAATLTSKLTALISAFGPPADVTDIRSIRKSMGIVLKGENSA